MRIGKVKFTIALNFLNIIDIEKVLEIQQYFIDSSDNDSEAAVVLVQKSNIFILLY